MEDKLIIQLDAEIYNAEKDIEICTFLQGITYTGQWNKRFETYLNKISGETFGTKQVEKWGMNNATVDFPLVQFRFNKKDYGDGYTLKYFYEGKQVSYDYDTKEYKIGSKYMDGYFYTVENVADIIYCTSNKHYRSTKKQHCQIQRQ